MNNLKYLYGLRYNVDILSTLEGAKRFVKRSEKPMCIILGDNTKYWVVCFADAQKLQTKGYGLLKF